MSGSPRAVWSASAAASSGVRWRNGRGRGHCKTMYLPALSPTLCCDIAISISIHLNQEANKVTDEETQVKYPNKSHVKVFWLTGCV